MKFACSCGAIVHDVGDYKGHLLSDQDLDGLLGGIDRAIESDGPGEARAMAVRRAFNAAMRRVWQCRPCGRLHVERDDGSLQEFVPDAGAPPPRLFQALSR